MLKMNRGCSCANSSNCPKRGWGLPPLHHGEAGSQLMAPLHYSPSVARASGGSQLRSSTCSLDGNLGASPVSPRPACPGHGEPNTGETACGYLSCAHKQHGWSRERGKKPSRRPSEGGTEQELG